MYKVERKSADTKSAWYEVMLSPFSSKEEVAQYICKYQVYYPVEDRNYRVSKMKV